MRIFIVCFCLVCAACSMTPKVEEPAEVSANPAAIDALQSALNSRDFTQLEPWLDADYSVQGIPAAFAKQVIQQVVTTYPRTLDAIEITATQQDAGNTLYTVDFVSGEESRQHTLLLSEAGKFLEINIFKTQTKELDAAEEEDTILPEMMQVNFIPAGNLMLIEATVNDTTGYFLVDSGAPSMILNSLYFAAPQAQMVQGLGVGGAVTGSSTIPVKRFVWGEYQINHFDAITMELSHIEQELQKPILGLISKRELEPFEAVFDYAQQQITLYKLDAQGTPVKQHAEPVKRITFTMAAHLPLVPCSYGAAPLVMALDTGAEVNLLDDSLPIDFPLQDARSDTLSGAGKERIAIQSGTLASFAIDGQEYPDMRFLISDIDHISSATGTVIHGLIGHEFISRQPTGINYRTGEITLYE